MTTPTDNASPALSDLRDKDDFDFLGLLDVVLEARWLIISVAVATAIIGGVYAFLSQPVYQADILYLGTLSQAVMSEAFSQLGLLVRLTFLFNRTSFNVSRRHSSS